MDFQIATILDPMDTAAKVGRVGDEIGDSRELFQVGEKRPRIQPLCQSSGVRADHVRIERELVVAGFPIEKFRIASGSIQLVEFGQHRVQVVAVEKFIDHDVRERLALHIALVRIFAEQCQRLTPGFVVKHGHSLNAATALTSRITPTPSYDSGALYCTANLR